MWSIFIDHKRMPALQVWNWAYFWCFYLAISKWWSVSVWLSFCVFWYRCYSLQWEELNDQIGCQLHPNLFSSFTTQNSIQKIIKLNKCALFAWLIILKLMTSFSFLVMKSTIFILIVLKLGFRKIIIVLYAKKRLQKRLLRSRKKR